MALLFTDSEAALNRWKWVEKTRTVNGARWSFEDREYLKQIYLDESDVIVLKKCRQVEMTEFLVNMLLYYACERPGTTILYTSALYDQVKRVSKDRVARAIRTSNYIRTTIDKPDIGVEAMRFKNDSVVYFVSAWGDGDAARNIPADIAIVDEVQDVSQAAVEAIREGMSHSNLKRLFLVGSPKLAGAEFDRGMWRHSDMKEWAWNEDKTDGHWYPTASEDVKTYYSGYHISQHMAPWITAEQIQEKKETYTEQKFVNEVLGEFYTGGAVKLTIDQLLACTDTERGWDVDDHVAPSVHFAGIDWGDRSWMVIMDKAGTVKQWIWWDDRADLSKVREAIKKYNIRYVVADMGFGKSEVGRLQSEYGYKVWGCQYVDQQGVTFKKGSYKLPDGGEDMTKPVLNANRTDVMDIVYERIYKKEYSFPYIKPIREKMEVFFQHMLAPFEEFVTGGAGGMVTKKRYQRSGPDHTFHAMVYATIATMMGGGAIPLGKEEKDLDAERRLKSKEYYPQEKEMDSWYDFNHGGGDIA